MHSLRRNIEAVKELNICNGLSVGSLRTSLKSTVSSSPSKLAWLQHSTSIRYSSRRVGHSSMCLLSLKHRFYKNSTEYEV